VILIQKELIICLDDSMKFTHKSHNSTIIAVWNDVDKIITPCAEFFSHYYTKRYMVYAITKDEKICLNEMILKNMVRPAQNAAAMLLSGCFGLIEINKE
jgi:hypothetical protein